MLADPDLIIDIIDIGVGIAESDRDKIFNPSIPSRSATAAAAAPGLASPFPAL